MTFDHRTIDIHRADLDREIETIRQERALSTAARPSLVDRARRNTGRALIAAGEALGAESKLRAHRA
jgi:hypothetical protein